MKTLKTFFLIILIALPGLAGDVKTGDDVIAAMYKKYEGKWFKTITFIQETVTHKPDGTLDKAIWYEALSLPGKLRIDIAPLEKGDGMLFSDGKIHQFRDGKAAPARPFVHPLLVLGFDVYAQPVAKTLEQLKGFNIDLSTVHEAKWQGRDAYVVGAKQGDMTAPQFWIDKKNFYFVRLIQMTGRERKNVSETQFNKYYKAKGGGWVSPEVLFFVDGKPTISEYYTDVQVNVPLDAQLWEPEKWMTANRTYFKLK
jgi:hypothetical protein